MVTVLETCGRGGSVVALTGGSSVPARLPALVFLSHLLAVAPRYYDLYIYLKLPGGFSALFERRNVCSFRKLEI